MSDCQHLKCQEGKPSAAAVGNLCGLHFRGLQADVDDIARVVILQREPDTGLALLLPGGTSDGVRTVPGSRPPIRMAALLDREVTDIIRGWAADLVATDRMPDIGRAVMILAAHVERIADHAAVDIVCEELAKAATEARRVLPDERWNTAADDRKPRAVGRCKENASGFECGGNLHWLANTLAVRCSTCGATIDPPGWLPKRLVLAAWKQVSRRTLDRWIAAGKVAAVDRLVCVDDVRGMVGTLRHAAGEMLD